MNLNWSAVGSQTRNVTQHGQIPKTKLKEHRRNQTLAWKWATLGFFPSDSEPTFLYPAAKEVIRPSAVHQPAQRQNKCRRGSNLRIPGVGRSSFPFSMVYVCGCFNSPTPGSERRMEPRPGIHPSPHQTGLFVFPVCLGRDLKVNNAPPRHVSNTAGHSKQDFYGGSYAISHSRGSEVTL